GQDGTRSTHGNTPENLWAARGIVSQPRGCGADIATLKNSDGRERLAALTVIPQIEQQDSVASPACIGSSLQQFKAGPIQTMHEDNDRHRRIAGIPPTSQWDAILRGEFRVHHRKANSLRCCGAALPVLKSAVGDKEGTEHRKNNEQDQEDQAYKYDRK